MIAKVRDGPMLRTSEAWLAQRRVGAFYTPEFLANWVAARLLRELQDQPAPVVLDPACGDGALLRAVRDQAQTPVELVGVDIDPAALALAQRRLGSQAQLVAADAVLARWDALGGRTPNGVVMNPPWGATVSLPPAALRAAGYGLASGQFDSFGLFVERALRTLPPGTPMAFILPDSLLQPEHEGLRRLLLAESQLKLIARLGEGIFPGVYRSTLVLVLVSGPPPSDALVRCLQLTPEQRRAVMSGARTMEDVETATGHDVPQTDFSLTPQASLNPAGRVTERALLTRFSREPSVWDDWVTIGRGVEIGKQGTALCCPACGLHRPLPRAGRTPAPCEGCGLRLLTTRHRARLISFTKPEGGSWSRLIVGEDVRRYTCAPSRWVRRDAPGINYKDPSAYQGRKLLIRKTGIGLHSAIDASDALTTQVVFHVRATERAPAFALDYVQGVLASRVLQAVHLRRSGDDQWRSHPYVTPSVLRTLPVPLPKAGTRAWLQAEAIAAAARAVGEAPRRDRAWQALELRVDRLVAGLLGLRQAECNWVIDVLRGAESLDLIRQLRLADGDVLRPERVA